MRANILGNLPAGAPPTLQMLQAGDMSVAQMRALRPLPENAQKLIDDAVVRVGLDRLAIVADLLAEGLTFNIGQDFWGTTQLQWDTTTEVGHAHRTMDPEARGENQMVDRTGTIIPIYLTWDDFKLGVRTIAASQRGGAPIDTTMVEQATRRVNEAIEDSAINGIAAPVFGSSVPGLLNAPNVNAFTYETNTAWDAAGKTGEEILQDLLGMIDLARTDRKFGPYNLYVNTAYGNKLNEDFKANSDKTIRMRLEEVVAGGRGIRVREADQMPTNRTALVQMTSDVIDVVVGQQPTTVSWDAASGWSTQFVVLACVVPRVKTTASSQSGIVVGNI
jgi:uncharacterized linocin/CFP29 family protein